MGSPSRGWMFFERFAYLSVFKVSSNWTAEGETFAIITVRQLPPSESLSSRVSFESRKGTWSRIGLGLVSGLVLGLGFGFGLGLGLGLGLG